MRLDMSYSTCEPLPELQDNRGHKGGSVPGSGASTRKGSSESRNSGTFFPQISRSKGCSSAESSYNDDNDGNQDRRAHSDTEQYSRNKNNSMASCPLVATPGNGSPTKFPQINIQYNKSRSVTSLCSNRSRNTPPRAEMCKSPSCPSLWSEYDDPGFVENGDLNASIHPQHTRKSTGDCVKLPELYDNCVTGGTPRTDRSDTTQKLKKGSKIERELHQLSLRRQREEEELKQRFRKAHRQQQLERQVSQPASLLLPIRGRPNRAKESSNNSESQSKSQSYNRSYSVKSDSGVSTSLRQSDNSDRADESEWSGWEEGEQHTQGDGREDEDEEYGDAEEDDPGYENEDEYDYANEGEIYYDEETGQRYCEDRQEYENEQGSYEQCEDGQQGVQGVGVIISGYRGARHRRFRVAQSQDAQDYQPQSQIDSTEKCQEWLNDRRRGSQKEST